MLIPRSALDAFRYHLRRHGLLLFTVLCAITFVALAIEASEPEVFGIDYTVDAFAQAARQPWLMRPMHWLSNLGSGYVMIPLNVAVLGFLWFRRHRWALWVPALTAGSVLVEGLAKWLVHRPRPKGTHYGFPSGHVTGAVVFFGALVYLIWMADLPRRWRWVATSLALVTVLGIASARIYLHAHWFSDVLGGFAGGTAYLGFGINWIERRRVSGESLLPGPRARECCGSTR
jgi:membrane-associated phospholipid phosphatase